MSEPCPFCGAKSIDVTTSDDLNGFDRRARFICTGATCHEWREGDGPEPEPEPEPEKPGIFQRIKQVFA